jgi:SAM-dependent methyltransferase
MSKNYVSAENFYRVMSRSYDLITRQGLLSDPNTVYRAVEPFLTLKMKDVLDVGIGTGLSSLPFRERGMSISGVDGSREMLDICKSKNIAKSLIQFDFETAALPVPDDSYDVTISHATLYLVANADFVMEDMIHKTRPGGLVAFNYEPSDVAWVRDNEAYPSASGEKQHIKTYSLPSEDIADLFNRHGMERLSAVTEPAYEKGDGTKIFFETLVYRKPFSL